MKDIFEVINNRRSVREYKKEQLKDDEIKKILDAGFMAPTSQKEVPWFFTVIQDETFLNDINSYSLEVMKKSGDEFLEKIANSQRNILHNAPTLVIVSVKNNTGNMEADASAAIENILLAAEGLDIGSCWLGLIQIFFKDKNNIRKLNIPEDYTPVYGVSLGYKAKDNVKIERNKDTFNWIK